MSLLLILRELERGSEVSARAGDGKYEREAGSERRIGKDRAGQDEARQQSGGGAVKDTDKHGGSSTRDCVSYPFWINPIDGDGDDWRRRVSGELDNDHQHMEIYSCARQLLSSCRSFLLCTPPETQQGKEEGEGRREEGGGREAGQGEQEKEEKGFVVGEGVEEEAKRGHAESGWGNELTRRRAVAVVVFLDAKGGGCRSRVTAKVSLAC
eukprot:768158-Hanusia_phi.AAC.2